MAIKAEDIDNIQKIVGVTAEALTIITTLALSVRKLISDSKELEAATKDQLLAKIDECISSVSHMPEASEIKP